MLERRAGAENAEVASVVGQVRRKNEIEERAWTSSQAIIMEAFSPARFQVFNAMAVVDHPRAASAETVGKGTCSECASGA